LLGAKEWYSFWLAGSSGSSILKAPPALVSVAVLVRCDPTAAEPARHLMQAKSDRCVDRDALLRFRAAIDAENNRTPTSS
jgi:hypothetical protein